MLWLFLGLGLFALLVLLKTIMLRLKKGLWQAVEIRLNGEQAIKTEPWANFFGLASKGMGQMRGNGALVLTGDELFFIMAAPRREVSIPLSSIKKVHIKKSHLGKTVGHPLLAVDYVFPEGEDSSAWALAAPEEWKSVIEKAIRRVKGLA